MPTRLTDWMYYKRGMGLEYDDNNQPGYEHKKEAERDETAFKRSHPSVVTRIYNVGGVIKGKEVNWYNIIYKNRLRVEAERQLRWNIGIEIEDIKSKKVFIEREQVLAKNKDEIARYVKGTKWARDKRYKIIKIHVDKATGY